MSASRGIQLSKWYDGGISAPKVVERQADVNTCEGQNQFARETEGRSKVFEIHSARFMLSLEKAGSQPSFSDVQPAITCNSKSALHDWLGGHLKFIFYSSTTLYSKWEKSLAPSRSSV